MSASNAAAEPSMEEILSSIRQAINEDIPGSVPENTGDPFASGSSAEAAFSSPPPGQAFDAAVHETHDPFAELTRKLNETRESVQKQMHGVSSNLKSEQTEASSGSAAEPVREPIQPEAPAAPVTQAPVTPPSIDPSPAAAAPSMQSAPAMDAPKPKPEPHPLRAAVFSSEPAPSQSAPAPKTSETSGGLAALTARVADEFRTPSPAAPTEPARTEPEPETPPAPELQQPAPQPQTPELKWSPPTAPAPSPSADTAATRPAESPLPSITSREPEPAPRVESKAEEDPFPKLTAIVERASLEKTSQAKTDDAMVDLVLRRILEPAVKSWLDENLPKIVTEVVREEVRRVAEQAN